MTNQIETAEETIKKLKKLETIENQRRVQSREWLKKQREIGNFQISAILTGDQLRILNDIKKASRLTISSGQIIGYALQSINNKLEVKDIVKEIVFKIFDSPTDESPQQDQSTKTETNIKFNIPNPSEYPNNQPALPIETLSIQQEEPQRIIKQRRNKEETQILEMQVMEDINNGMITKDVCNKYNIDPARVCRMKKKIEPLKPKV